MGSSQSQPTPPATQEVQQLRPQSQLASSSTTSSDPPLVTRRLSTLPSFPSFTRSRSAKRVRPHTPTPRAVSPSKRPHLDLGLGNADADAAEQPSAPTATKELESEHSETNAITPSAPTSAGPPILSEPLVYPQPGPSRTDLSRRGTSSPPRPELSFSPSRSRSLRSTRSISVPAPEERHVASPSPDRPASRPMPIPVPSSARPISSSSPTPSLPAAALADRAPRARRNSLPETSGAPNRTISSSLTAFLGFSAPVHPTPVSESVARSPSPRLDSPSASIPPSAPSAEIGSEVPLSPAAPSSLSSPLPSSTSDLSVLTAQLDAARADLQQSRRELEAAREEVERRQAEIQQRRIPTGAVLVIQGLAQTHAVMSDASSEVPVSRERSGAGVGTGTDAPTESRDRARGRPRHVRRSSDGSLLRRRGGQEPGTEGPSLEAQARMIGGLLTVAATATASTLFSSSAPVSTTHRSTAASVLEGILNRLRPNRPNRTAHSIERALGNYLRNVVRDNRPLDETSGLSLPIASGNGGGEGAGAQAGAATASAEFQRFLEVLQMDLVGAVREFATPLRPGDGSEVPDTPMTEPVPEETVGEAAPVEDTSLAQASAEPDAAGGPSENTTSEASAVAPFIPTFHRQLGQNVPTIQRSSGVSGGHDGVPRRLNFFRAHVFSPALPGTFPGGEEDPEAIVPCIFIGVRSIAHDPRMTTDELVQHPNFPFADGQVPLPEREGGAAVSTSPPENAANRLTPGSPSTRHSLTPSSTLPSLSRVSSSSLNSPPILTSPSTPGPSSRRTFRERVLARLNRRTSPHPGALNTYLVYVIGGNYPRNHPVMRIPNLLTGAPLSDEEMQLVGELMGQVKPPTASKAEIEGSGLSVVDGEEMGRLGAEGKVLDSCVEKCLICLSEYEPGEECRVLQCRHAYHKECVDHWLSEGSNSCPACRTEAVRKGDAAHVAASAIPNAAPSLAAAGPSGTVRDD